MQHEEYQPLVLSFTFAFISTGDITCSTCFIVLQEISVMSHSIAFQEISLALWCHCITGDVVHKLKIGNLKIRQPKHKMLPWTVIGLLLVVYCWLIG